MNSSFYFWPSILPQKRAGKEARLEIVKAQNEMKKIKSLVNTLL